MFAAAGDNVDHVCLLMGCTEARLTACLAKGGLLEAAKSLAKLRAPFVLLHWALSRRKLATLSGSDGGF